MTKREIQKVLKERFGIEVTLRPRKATLQRLLKDAVAKSTKAGCSGWYEKIEEATKVQPKRNYWLLLPISLFMLSLYVLLPW